ncbi:FHA domain-containing protein [Oxynema aestuarii]|uniref:FHA domain-containing protein n=1 Tax=Oxynema aestuarii AP17 TaxID=2064643 RepID=A0A6H1U3D4_9CYAN|nr:FHA domain-containing protein [Oxynema aestuarii]QIZ72670.1 FHA domain-containing protein [Oxynema aestuarii AP17]RMH73567.1 MAG: FHA domain-containing protein [Cyanobacteria bacterium J007]
MITLTLLHPHQATPIKSWSFENESMIRIGRSRQNNVVLYSAVVSRHHVELRRYGDRWELINLGTNGTYLEGTSISHIPVEDGVVVRLARSGPRLQIHLGRCAPKVHPEKDVVQEWMDTHPLLETDSTHEDEITQPSKTPMQTPSTVIPSPTEG